MQNFNFAKLRIIDIAWESPQNANGVRFRLAAKAEILRLDHRDLRMQITRICSKISACPDSSVGRAKDWKSLCRWFDSTLGHHRVT